MWRKTIIVLSLIILFHPLVGYAALPGRDGIKATADRAGLNTDSDTSLLTIIGSVISTLLGLLGVIFLVLIIYAGFLWMTAQGNTDQVDRAKNILKTAIVGIVIVLSSYAISVFVFDRILISTVGTGS
ncbi:MAG: hypothetical protein V1738_06455 [Patescibacteria group bacterium]